MMYVSDYIKTHKVYFIVRTLQKKSCKVIVRYHHSTFIDKVSKEYLLLGLFQLTLAKGVLSAVLFCSTQQQLVAGFVGLGISNKLGTASFLSLFPGLKQSFSAGFMN